MSILDQHVQGLMKAFDAPWPGPRGQEYTLKSDLLELVICPEDGARILSLKYKGIEVLRQHNEQRKAFQYGCFPMIPWVGRLAGGDIKFNQNTYHLYQNKGPNAMHGIAHFYSWEVVEISKDSIVLMYTLGNPWPWSGRVYEKRCIKNNILNMSLKVESNKDCFPASVGWHPWFLKDPKGLGHECLTVSFEADSMEEIVDELPTTRKLAVRPGPYDDCFNFNNYDAGAKLDYVGDFSIKISSNCPALIVFDKQPDATCVNTMTGVPNDINTNPNVVTPIKPLEARATWEFI